MEVSVTTPAAPPPGAAAASATVTGNFLRLGAGELVARITGFGVLIYLAHVLGPDLYGLVGFAYAAVLYFGTIADFGVETLGPRDLVGRRAETVRVASAVITVRVLTGAVLSAALALFALGFMPEPDGRVLALYALLLLAIGGSARWVHLGLERTGAVAGCRVAGEVLRAALTLLLVRRPADLLLVPVLHVAGEGLTTLLLWWSLRRRGIALRPSWEPRVALPVMRSGWPVVVNLVLGMALYNSDVLLLKAFRPAAEVGLYLAAYTLITLLGNLATAYSTSLLPTLARVGQRSEGDVALYRNAIAQVALAGVPIAVGGFLLAPQLMPFVFGPAYADAARPLQVLVLTTPLLLVRMVQHSALFARGRQDRVLWATATAAACNIGVNLFVIPAYGMIGAALTTLGSEVLRTVLTQYFAHAEGFARAVLPGLARPLVASIAMGILLLVVPSSSLLVSMLLGGAAYFAALVLTARLQAQAARLPGLRT